MNGHDHEPRIFISYSHQDKKWCDWLYDELIEIYGNGVWRDTDILPGEYWKDKIIDQLNLCDLVVCIVSEDSLRSEMCIVERKIANSIGIPVLDICLAEGLELRIEVSARQAIKAFDFKIGDKKVIVKLKKGINKILDTKILPRSETKTKHPDFEKQVETAESKPIETENPLDLLVSEDSEKRLEGIRVIQVSGYQPIEFWKQSVEKYRKEKREPKISPAISETQTSLLKPGDDIGFVSPIEAPGIEETNLPTRPVICLIFFGLLHEESEIIRGETIKMMFKIDLHRFMYDLPYHIIHAVHLNESLVKQTLTLTESNTSDDELEHLKLLIERLKQHNIMDVNLPEVKSIEERITAGSSIEANKRREEQKRQDDESRFG